MLKINNLDDLKSLLKIQGFESTPENRYPYKGLWEFVKITNPEILKDYQDWFDREIRKENKQ